eukprot:jgi/Mesvir1/14205/Mv25151-RA.1
MTTPKAKRGLEKELTGSQPNPLAIVLAQPPGHANPPPANPSPSASPESKKPCHDRHKWSLFLPGDSRFSLLEWQILSPQEVVEVLQFLTQERKLFVPQKGGAAIDYRNTSWLYTYEEPRQRLFILTSYYQRSLADIHRALTAPAPAQPPAPSAPSLCKDDIRAVLEEHVTWPLAEKLTSLNTTLNTVEARVSNVETKVVHKLHAAPVHDAACTPRRKLRKRMQHLSLALTRWRASAACS